MGRRVPIRVLPENGNFQYFPEVPLDAQKRQVWGTLRTFPDPRRNHPARFSVGSWRGENLKSWRANFAGPEVSFSDFQDFSFPGRFDEMKICTDTAHPTSPPPGPGGRDQDAAQLHRLTRSRTFPTRAFSAPRCTPRPAHGDCICTSA
jgi:hypothetical protein